MAVIVSEFGEAGLDHDLIEALDADILTVTPKPEFLENCTPKPEQDGLTGGYFLPLSPVHLNEQRNWPQHGT
ncbi:hypothetical protein [Roseobacter weihaiensis]|uniref:hypothetical protein n=1 Tax=Roseobacter weihaiensis TaxID=2763262 RepID=UPI0029CABFF2|nr:hypothetical protein [Roseobacter sp. H9]